MGKRVNVEFDEDNLEWLRNRYPGMSIWWLMNEFLRKFRARHEEGKEIQLASYIESAATEKAETLLDGGKYD